MQADVLRAYYKNNDLGGANGFLDYYQKNVSAFVNSPFRINANLNLQIDYCIDDPDVFSVNETMSWICKSNGGKIQETIEWAPGDGEFKEIKDFQVSIQHKSLISKDNHSDKMNFDNEALLGENNEKKMGFCLPLKEHSALDELYVVVKVKCTIAKERFIAWRMSLPTKGMNLTVQFPKDLQIAEEFYFNENNLQHFEKDPGYYHLSVEDWIMPDQGITIQLLKAIDKEKEPAETDEIPIHENIIVMNEEAKNK